MDGRKRMKDGGGVQERGGKEETRGQEKQKCVF